MHIIRTCIHTQTNKQPRSALGDDMGMSSSHRKPASSSHNASAQPSATVSFKYEAARSTQQHSSNSLHSAQNNASHSSNTNSSFLNTSSSNLSNLTGQNNAATNLFGGLSMLSEAKEAAFSSFNDAFSKRLPMMKMQSSIWGSDKKDVSTGSGKASAGGGHAESKQESGTNVTNAGGKLLNRVMSMGSESSMSAAGDAHRAVDDHTTGNNNAVLGPGNLRFVHANTMSAASGGTRNANLSRSISSISTMSAASFSNKGTHWMDDSAVSRCFECNMTFHMFNRKHHCRACGRIFCDKCSQRRAYIDGTMQRVCDHCFQRRALHDASTLSPSGVPNSSSTSHSPSIAPAISPRHIPGLSSYSTPLNLTATSVHVHPLSTQNTPGTHGQNTFGRSASLQGDDRRSDADDRANNFPESTPDRSRGGGMVREYYYEDDDNFRRSVQNDADDLILRQSEDAENQLDVVHEGEEPGAALRVGYVCCLWAWMCRC